MISQPDLFDEDSDLPVPQPEVGRFRHIDSVAAFLSELYEINERVLTGDIASAKAAIASKRMTKLVKHYTAAMTAEGAEEITLEPYVAAGGWVGIRMSYDIGGCTVNHSCTPRRV
jgi:hypothetical protein